MLKKFFIPAASIAGITLSSLVSATPIAVNNSTTKFTQKADTLLVILDASSSKNAIYDGDSSESTVFDVEKQLLQRVNNSIPQNLKLSTGLRTFGFGSCLNWSSTQLVQAVSPHSSTNFQTSLDAATCAGGSSPLEAAIEGASSDLSANTGSIALLVVADGHKLSTETLTQATALEKQFGDRLCIYSVWVGNKNEKSGQFVLQELSNIAGCGKSVDIASVSSDATTASFVEAMLYNKTTVAAKPVALDDDNDGVPNSADNCPTTPKKAIVNKKGCWAFSGVEFNHGKSSIKSGYESLFDNATEILKANPNLIVEIQGHTDSTGSAKFNKQLSGLRAKGVKALLVKNGIESSRLTTKGFGESSPIATNDTEEGRATNRRVEFKAAYK
ncbi:MAG: OmpA family protein [Methyloprofundus sp.]|nr:OmpA family protein [Methyloprofundus sp.]